MESLKIRKIEFAKVKNGVGGRSSKDGGSPNWETLDIATLANFSCQRVLIMTSLCFNHANSL